MNLIRNVDRLQSENTQAYGAEEELLCLADQICRLISISINEQKIEKIVISIFTNDKDECAWKRTVSVGDVAYTLFVMELFEYLLWLSCKRPSESILVLIYTTQQEQQKLPIEYVLPPVPFCEKILDFYDKEENEREIQKEYNQIVEAADQCTDLREWRLNNKSIEADDLTLQRLKRMATYAIYGEQSSDIDRLNQISSFSTDNYTQIQTSYHPRVLMQRLKMAIYLREEIKLTSESHSNHSGKDEYTLGEFSVFSSELRFICSQFTSFGNELYSLDQRYGTICFCVYRKLLSCSSVRPFPLLNTAEKIILDIWECNKKGDDTQKIKILLVGSIDYADLDGIMKIFSEECKPSIFRKITLKALSPLPPPSQDRISSYQNIYYDNIKDDPIDLFSMGIMDYDIVFLIDAFLLYTLQNRAALLEIPQPAHYSLTEDTLRNDIIHAAYESGQGYMNYAGKLSLHVREFVDKVKLCRRAANLSHLCILLSYPEQTELISLSCDTQEVRKEIASQNSYTTLLRYCFDPITNQEDEDDRNSRPAFLFRLHQWFKMTSPALSQWMVKSDDSDEATRLDRLLYHIICRFSISKETGDWQLQLFQDSSERKLADESRECILNWVHARICLGMEHGRHVEDSVRLAKQAFANLLVSRSISKRYLVFARSIIYQNPKNIEVQWNDRTTEQMDIVLYNRKLRKYHTRYSDYLILCAIDKSGQNLISAIRTSQLISALGKKDGYTAIQSLSDICHQEYENEHNDEGGKDIDKFFMRIIEQSRYFLR